MQAGSECKLCCFIQISLYIIEFLNTGRTKTFTRARHYVNNNSKHTTYKFFLFIACKTIISYFLKKLIPCISKVPEQHHPFLKMSHSSINVGNNSAVFFTVLCFSNECVVIESLLWCFFEPWMFFLPMPRFS